MSALLCTSNYSVLCTMNSTSTNTLTTTTTNLSLSNTSTINNTSRTTAATLIPICSSTSSHGSLYASSSTRHTHARRPRSLRTHVPAFTLPASATVGSLLASTRLHPHVCNPSHLSFTNFAPHRISSYVLSRRQCRYQSQKFSQKHLYSSTLIARVGNVNGNGNGNGSDEQQEWVEALEGLLVEALRTYYQGTPLFSDSEFNTLRDELEHLGLAQVRLNNVEKIWVQATSARDFDRRLCQEFDLSEEDLSVLKNRLLIKGLVTRPSIKSQRQKKMTNSNNNKSNEKRSQKTSPPIVPDEQFLRDASKLSAVEDVNERLKWFLFSDATEERFKILLIYLPAVVMSFVTASILTILFALLDGEMQITVTQEGRIRLGILSYITVMLTFWISNRFTPTVLEYLDIGHPVLIRGTCPICGANVSCLFTGAARVRDERKCSMCSATVGFNRRWRKTYLVSPPGKPVQSPD